jgi:hypothetical protein
MARLQQKELDVLEQRLHLFKLVGQVRVLKQ